MAVEAKLSKLDNGSPNYPYLGKSSKTGAIVYFTDDSVGVCVFSEDEADEVGLNTSDWKMHLFTPLSPSESITLRNV